MDGVKVFCLAQFKRWSWLKHKTSKMTFFYSD